MKCDRKRVMQDAWRRYRDGQRLNMGWDFAHCLRTAWSAERIRVSDAYQHTYRRAA